MPNVFYYFRQFACLKKVQGAARATLLIVMACLTLVTKSKSQTFDLSVENEPIQSVFKKIQSQSGFEFLYSTKILKGANPVTFNARNAELKQLLQLCFKEQPFTYSIMGKTIVIKPLSNKNLEKEETPQPPVNKTEVPIIVKGKIVDEEGNVLNGVSITVKGMPYGTTSDLLGNFILSIPNSDPATTLQVSYVGYEPQEIKLSKSTVLTIVMQKNIKRENEIVIVGYGTQKRSDVLGSVSTISEQELKNSPFVNLYEALQGRIPGLSISTQNFQPGSELYAMFIRGKTTGINWNVGGRSGSSGEPLVIIDGIEGRMNMVNKDDILSISVLKDAASAAIYGSRAANGVILIKTKRGEGKPLTLNYQGYIGMQKVITLPEFLPSWQQAELVNEALKNEASSGGGGEFGPGVIIGGGGRARKYTAKEIEKFKSGTDPAYANTDWMKLLYSEKGLQQNHILTLSGSDKKTNYSISLGYFSEKGIIKEVSNERYSGRVNINSKLSNKLEVISGMSFQYGLTNEPITSQGNSLGNLIGFAVNTSPTVPLKWKNGEYSSNNYGVNAIAWINSDSYRKTNGSVTTGNISINWSPIKEITIQPQIGVTYSADNSKIFVPRMIAYLNSEPGTPLSTNEFLSNKTSTLEETIGSSLYIQKQITVNFNKYFGNHQITALAGAAQNHSIWKNLSAERYGLLNNKVQQIDLAPPNGQRNRGMGSESATNSFFGRVSYNYDNRYYLEHNIRADASLSFKNKWGIFPGVAAGWVISNEPFFKNSDKLYNAVNFLKIRASWGQLGNTSVGDFYYLRRLTSVNTAFNQQPTVAVHPYLGYEEDIKWETTAITNIGLEASLFKDKLNLTFEVYEKKTKDILMTLGAPANYGLSAPYENIGKMNNRGLEATLGYNDKMGKFLWDARLTYAYNQDKVISLKNGLVPSAFGGLRTSVGVAEGYSYFALFGLVAEGIYQTQDEVDKSAKLNNTVGPGDIKYKDVNKDGRIDTKDKVYLGRYTAPSELGLILNGKWKNFGISCFWQGVMGKKASIGNALGRIGNEEDKATIAFWNRWTPNNPTQKFPRAWNTYEQNDPQSVASSFWIKDASYIRLKNVTISYDLSMKWSKKVGIKSAQLYSSCNNLLTFSHFYKWMDPESAGFEASLFQYPPTRTFTVGANLYF